MKHTPLDIYDDMPRAMRAYVSNYGFHFSKKAFDEAVSMMRKRNSVSGKPEKIEVMDKAAVDALLDKYSISLERKILYDYVYVANMAKADYWKSSISDEQHLAMFIKDYVDDLDSSDETPFRRWLATLVGNGEPLEWEDVL